MRKYSVILLLILLLSFAIWYFQSMSLNTIINKHLDISTIDIIEIDINKTVFTKELHEIRDKSTIDDLLNNIRDIKVRRTIKPTSSYTFNPKLYDTYYIMLLTKNNVINVDFMDKDYLIVKGQTYKILDKPDLKQIYDIVNPSK